MATKTVKIEAELSEPLDRELRSLAATTGRSVSSLISEAIDTYVDAQREFIQAVEEGVAAAEDGRLVDHDAVAAEFERRRRRA